MTAAAERAETYLRLMAEAELRRALAYPRSEPPEPSGLAPAVRSAVHLSRPVLAPLFPPLRSAAARVSSPLLGFLWPTARTAVWAARRTPAVRAAEPVLWRTLRIRRAVQPLLPGRGRGAPHPAEALDRIGQVAGTLVSAGVLSEAAAREVLQGLMDALVLRGKLGPGPQFWLPGLGPWDRRFPGPAAGPGARSRRLRCGRYRSGPHCRPGRTPARARPACSLWPWGRAGPS